MNTAIPGDRIWSSLTPFFVSNILSFSFFKMVLDFGVRDWYHWFICSRVLCQPFSAFWPHVNVCICLYKQHNDSLWSSIFSNNILGINTNVYKAADNMTISNMTEVTRAYINFRRGILTTLAWDKVFPINNHQRMNKIMLCPSNNPPKHVFKWFHHLLYKHLPIHIYSQHDSYALFTANRGKNHLRFPTKHKYNMTTWYI